jgi:two-component system phosphate regulon sensor histidine kinase PhoR
VFSSIRWRTAAVFVLLLLICITGISIYLSHFFRDSYLSQLESQLGNQAWLVSDSVGSQFEANKSKDINVIAMELSEGIEGRVTIIDKDGVVLGDSEEDPATMENHAHRPEVIVALSGKTGSSIRYSDTLGFDMMYVASPIMVSSGIEGVARVSLPLTEINSYLGHINVTIIWVSLLAAVIGMILSLQLSKLTIEPVKKLTQMSRKIADGELDHEVQMASRDEVGELATAFNLMTSKIREMVNVITSERDRMGVILSNMGDGILVVDSDSRITTINRAAEKMLHISKDSVIGHSVAEKVREYELDEILQRCIETKKQQSGSLEVSATKQFLLVIATPLEDEGGCLLLLQNLTELRRLEKVRRDFVSNISHELRTPIASVKALAESLQEGALDDPSVAKDFLARIDAETDKLTQMVQELGELASIESGEAPLRKEPVSIAEVIEQAVQRLKAQADRAGLGMDVGMPGDLPRVTADRDRIEQVLVNLIHNAIKFTPTGGNIRISAKSENSTVVISVADSGVGIPADDLTRIFERFYKADKARSGGGTGLGLSISKHIVEAHGGRIWAESVEGQGSTFHLTLPLESQV